jgi:Spy/CpxP family protein refolding chaperone
MNARVARNILVCLGLIVALGKDVSAQNRGPGGPPPGQRPPAGPGNPGSPGNAPNSGVPSTGSTSSSAANGNTSSSASRPGLLFGPAGRWWDDKAVVNSIGLRKEQQKRMDSIFDANKTAILTSYKTLETQKAKLDQMTKASNVDQTAVFAQVDAVSQARTALQKSTIKVLLEIRQQMDADQISKIDKLH